LLSYYLIIIAIILILLLFNYQFNSYFYNIYNQLIHYSFFIFGLSVLDTYLLSLLLTLLRTCSVELSSLLHRTTLLYYVLLSGFISSFLSS